MCLHTNLPKKTLFPTQLPHSVNWGQEPHTALSEVAAQLFRKEGSYLLPIRLSAAQGREHTENVQVTTVYSAQAVTLLLCSGCTGTESSGQPLVHLHNTVYYGKHTCSVHYLGISHQSIEKKTPNIS